MRQRVAERAASAGNCTRGGARAARRAPQSHLQSRHLVGRRRRRQRWRRGWADRSRWHRWGRRLRRQQRWWQGRRRRGEAGLTVRAIGPDRAERELRARTAVIADPVVRPHPILLAQVVAHPRRRGRWRWCRSRRLWSWWRRRRWWRCSRRVYQATVGADRVCRIRDQLIIMVCTCRNVFGCTSAAGTGRQR